MQTRTLTLLSRAIRPQVKTFLTPLQANHFCSNNSWKPIVPKYSSKVDVKSHYMAHPIWDIEAANAIKFQHRQPVNFAERVALVFAKGFRKIIVYFSGPRRERNEDDYLRMFILQETIAGVPGMMGGVARHFRSLGRLKKDSGTIHQLIKEAENERVHLFVFLHIRKPGIFYRLSILAAQGLYVVGYSLLYLISPRLAHRFVAFLKEGSVKSYDQVLEDIDAGKLPKWTNMTAPENAQKYWHFEKDQKFRDVLVAIRADKALHCQINHHIADLKMDAPFSDIPQPLDEKKQTIEQHVEENNK